MRVLVLTAKFKHSFRNAVRHNPRLQRRPDGAAIFPTTESVNDALRAIAALLANMSHAKSARRRRNSAVHEVARKAQTQVGSLAG